jgi:hypothetical protein
MSLRNLCRVRRQLRFNAIARLQQSGHGRNARGLKRQQSAARPNGCDHIVRCWGTQHPHCPWRRLLNAFEQCVSTAFGDPISVLDHNDLPPSQGRAHGRTANKLAHFVDADRELLGTYQRDVGMRTGQRRTTCGARPAASRAALQCRGEGSRRVRSSRTGRAGEQPGVAHGMRLACHRALERRNCRRLTDQLRPYASDSAASVRPDGRCGHGPTVPSATDPLPG